MGPPNNSIIRETHEILSLRLLIARAANSDSLAWWDDDALTPHARFVLERLFPVAPLLAARSLALVAATARHQAACPASTMLHLYRLDADNKDRLAVRHTPLLPIGFPEQPIMTTDALRAHLSRLSGGPLPFTVIRRMETGALQIQIPSGPPDMSPMLHRARALAWAYLEGAPGQPVFPYCTE
jgi:hypothetical protein